MNTEMKSKQYKVGILDDEMLIRQSIALKMDHFGFNVHLDSDDGYEVLEYLKENGRQALDLIFVDVEMPLMNGLEFIRQARELAPEMIFVIISGYNEFEYAQKALRQGVTDYLLKPIEPSKLNELLEKVYCLLEERESRMKEEIMDELSQYISSAGKISLSNTAIQSLKCRFTQGFQIIMIMLGNLESDAHWFGREFRYEIRTIIPARPNLLITLTDSYSRSQYIQDLKVNTSTTFVSSKLNDPLKLCKIINTGIKRIEENLILGEHTEIKEINSTEHSADIINRWEKKETRTLEAVEQLIQKKDYCMLTDQIIELLCSSRTPQWLIEKSWKKIANQLYQEFKDEDLLFGESWIRVIDEPEDFRREILNLLKQITRNEGGGAVLHSAKEAVDDILIYMNRNYNRDISLRDIAENRYYVNRSHLSRVFRSETGMTFNDMLTKIRVGKACEYLEDSHMKIREIAELVGFRDSRYFSQVFQKVSGKAPSEYRDEKQK